MPYDIVDIDLEVDAATLPDQTYSDALLVTVTAEEPSGAEFGEINRYRSSADVAEDYGEESDAHTAAQAVDRMGAEEFHVVAVEDAVDAAPDLSALDAVGGAIDLVGYADYEISTDEEDIDTLDELVGWAEANDAAVVAQYQDGREYEDDEAAMEAAHEIGTEVSSGHLLPVAHKSDADVSSHVLGQLATNEPYFDPLYDADGYPFGSEAFDPALIGDPGTAGTFEGGDEGEGPANVIINVAGVTVLSNSLTTAGVAADERYIDVTRTKMFVASEIEDALVGLRLQQDRIPFTEEGEAMIESTLVDTMDDLTGGTDAPLAESEVHVPPIDELDEGDRADRVWTDIQIDGRLAGNAHTFSLGLSLSA